MQDRDAVAELIRRAVNDAAASLGGTFSAEHGIGRTLTGEMSRYKSPVELSLMSAVKHAFDPLGLFNPGRVLPLTSPREVRPSHLRPLFHHSTQLRDKGDGRRE